MSVAERKPDTLLLNDFRPRSIYNIPQNTISKARFPVIDVHSHIFANSEKQLDEWIRKMDLAGVQQTVVLTMAHGRKFDDSVKFFSKYRDRFILYCGLDFTRYDEPGFGPGAVKELKRCHEIGAMGVGELGDKGKGLFYDDPPAWGMHIDDSRMDMIIDACAEFRMPINIHVGEPQWFYERMDNTNDGLMNAYNWRLDNQDGILNLDQHLEHLGRALSKHPETIFIACHFANQVTDLEKLGRMLDQYPNLYSDISARYSEVATIPRYTEAFIERHRDKLLYGTDMEIAEHMYETTFTILETGNEHFYVYHFDHIREFNYHWPLYGLGLSDETLRKLYFDNTTKILTIR